MASTTDYDAQSVVYDVLASAWRRQVLRSLVVGEGDVTPVEELVDELLDHDETDDDRQQVAINLHHVTLPKLAEAGFIEYDAQTQTARVCEHQRTEWHVLTISGR